jgi:hypothetical protein
MVAVIGVLLSVGGLGVGGVAGRRRAALGSRGRRRFAPVVVSDLTLR